MSKFLRFYLIGISLLIGSGHQAHAATSPISVAIVPPVQFPPADFNVAGIRASVGFGKHRDVYGLDVGVLGNVTTGNFIGIGIAGLANVTYGNTTILGVQLAGLANVTTQKTEVYGFQLALGMNSMTAESYIWGIQLAAANACAHTRVRGIQIGIYNQAQEVHGLQIGLINRVETLHGLQIGLANFHHNGMFVVSPILNLGW